jgi:hypothetical protein
MTKYCHTCDKQNFRFLMKSFGVFKVDQELCLVHLIGIINQLSREKMHSYILEIPISPKKME